MRLRMYVARFGAEILALVFGIALTFDRLLGLPGAESSLLVGALFSPIVGIAVALDGRVPKKLGLISASLLRGALLFSLVIAPLYAHSLFEPFCGPRDAALFLSFGALPGFLLAALLGVFARVYLKQRAFRIAFVLALTLGSIVLGVLEFLWTPGIAIYGEFGGYLPGTFYETGRKFPPEFLSYRLGSLFFGLALLGGIGLKLTPSRKVEMGLLLGIGLVGYGIVRVNAVELDHATSVKKIDEALGGIAVSERCRLHYPRELRPDLRALHLDECERFIAHVEALLGLEARREPIDVFLYRSSNEKRRLMGAGQIQLAKPWRSEVHLVIDRFPHPVLAHELAHVLGAEISTGLFGVPGAFFGIIPNAGLIEGFAVALAFNEALELDPHQASRALLELNRLPPLRDLTSLSFVRHPSSNAYAAAGSFLRFVLEREGAEKLKTIYRQSSLAPLGRSVAEIEEGFHRFLREIELPEGALELAAARFSRPSVFHASCPHETAQLRAQLGSDRAAGDLDAMLETAETILAVEPADLTARLARVRALALSGAKAKAQNAHDELMALNYPAPIVARSFLTLGDAAWLRAERDEAEAYFREALELPMSEDERRNLQLRLYAMERGGEIESAIRTLFLGEDGRGADSITVMNLSRKLDEAGEISLGAYLAARQLYFREAYRDALERLEQGGGALPTPEFERERIRMLLHCLVALGELDRARVLSAQYEGNPSFSRVLAAFRHRLTD